MTATGYNQPPMPPQDPHGHRRQAARPRVAALAPRAVLVQVEEVLAAARRESPAPPALDDDGVDWCALWARYGEMLD
ncbi:MAG TPA: hypothetical protein VKY74_11945 [Chloroflexia bacterium]|nr:hypothetical protein [Chloroflexia bacterium]